MDGKSSYSLLPQREPIQVCSAFLFALLLAVVVGGHKPDVPDYGERHAVAIVLYGENRVVCVKAIESDHNRFRVGIVGILDQFKDGKPGGSD
jgi:hypothetical protein